MPRTDRKRKTQILRIPETLKVMFSTFQNENNRDNMPSYREEMASKVPIMMGRSFRLLQNPRKFAVFDLVCSKSRLTTKDVEASTGFPLTFVNDTLRQLDELKLARFEGKSGPLTQDGRKTVREGDLEETFKCYVATEHGQLIHTLCNAYGSDRPLARLGTSLDPKQVVESFSKMKKDELALMLNKFRDMYLLGGTLISIYYHNAESATSRDLSLCLDGRLSKDEVEQLLTEYTGPDGLVVAESIDRNAIDRAFIRLGELLFGKNRVRKWLSKATYSLTSEGKRIAMSLSEDFYPMNLGVNEQFLRPEKIEADDGVLGRAIAVRVSVLAVLVGVTGYLWWDILHVTALNPTVAVAATIAVALDVVIWVFYVLFRLPNLVSRIRFWLELRGVRHAEGS
jgi:hypothetical protein